MAYSVCTVGFDYSNNQLVIRSFSPWVQAIPDDERTLLDIPELTNELLTKV
ncbi:MULTISPECIES: hypothetical protein [unclassified Photobacterium]|uniref:hypothetical protein n=1 Tax=unclassified Photobacterium TaxID=2628852 RepID=UPI001EDEC8E8|nr:MULTISPECIES: hypothetical protein [unclassified Photobacterium]